MLKLTTSLYSVQVCAYKLGPEARPLGSITSKQGRPSSLCRFVRLMCTCIDLLKVLSVHLTSHSIRRLAVMYMSARRASRAWQNAEHLNCQLLQRLGADAFRMRDLPLVSVSHRLSASAEGFKHAVLNAVRRLRVRLNTAMSVRCTSAKGQLATAVLWHCCCRVCGEVVRHVWWLG